LVKKHVIDQSGSLLLNSLEAPGCKTRNVHHATQEKSKIGRKAAKCMGFFFASNIHNKKGETSNDKNNNMLNSSLENSQLMKKKDRPFQAHWLKLYAWLRHVKEDQEE
jgi:hypothetical protein